MSRIKTAVILAAGNGRRIASVSGSSPKPLVNFNGKPMLEWIMLAAQKAGIERFVIIIGYRGEVIKARFENDNRFDITWCENPDYHKDNGISLLKAKSAVNEPFLLLMADHLFDPKTAAALLRQPLHEGEVMLAVDEKLESIFDMDDATKVSRIADYIIDIGKQIRYYDAVDTGMFLCSRSLFECLELVQRDGNCSLSDGMRYLAERRKFRSFAIGDALWQDVDSPEALDFAATLPIGRNTPVEHVEELTFA